MYFCTSKASKLGTNTDTCRRRCRQILLPQGVLLGGLAHAAAPSAARTLSRRRPARCTPVCVYHLPHHTSAYVSIRQRTLAIREHMSAYVCATPALQLTCALPLTHTGLLALLAHTPLYWLYWRSCGGSLPAPDLLAFAGIYRWAYAAYFFFFALAQSIRLMLGYAASLALPGIHSFTGFTGAAVAAAWSGRTGAAAAAAYFQKARICASSSTPERERVCVCV